MVSLELLFFNLVSRTRKMFSKNSKFTWKNVKKKLIEKKKKKFFLSIYFKTVNKQKKQIFTAIKANLGPSTIQ